MNRHDYLEMIEKGKAIIQEHYLWIFLGCGVLLVAYIMVHRAIMGSHKKKAAEPESDSGEA